MISKCYSYSQFVFSTWTLWQIFLRQILHELFVIAFMYFFPNYIARSFCPSYYVVSFPFANDLYELNSSFIKLNFIFEHDIKYYPPRGHFLSVLLKLGADQS
ncbi:unnamed protein product [Amoebophrya sp. A120]|nr:unnamed protein product [Amoebophrya sp. A120]|eukprot:GSA120T00013899001.1